MRLATVLLIASVGCAGAAGRGPQTPEAIVRAQSEPRALVDAATKASLEPEAFYAVLRTKQVVYVGERHDQPVDHGVQYAILRELHRSESSLAIGMEMFQIPFQQPLNEWSAGRIDETVLRRETEYDQRWGFDFSLLRPVLEYARSSGLEVVALNAPREVAYAVAQGGLDSLDPELAATLPELDLDDATHRAMFDTDDMDEKTMLGIAREMNLSETAFVRRSPACSLMMSLPSSSGDRRGSPRRAPRWRGVGRR